MRTFTKTIAIITIVILSCMLICGLWISSNGTDAEGIAFHRTLGIAGVASGMVTAITAMIALRKKKANAA